MLRVHLIGSEVISNTFSSSLQPTKIIHDIPKSIFSNSNNLKLYGFREKNSFYFITFNLFNRNFICRNVGVFSKLFFTLFFLSQEIRGKINSNEIE